MDQPEIHAAVDLFEKGNSDMPKAQQVVTVEAKEPAVAITPMQMLQIAVEQNADLDKLQKLMDLQERWEANEARKAFVAALNAFKAEPPEIVKNKKAGFDSKRTGERTQYEYATLDQVSDVIGQALSQHGLAHRWEINQGADAADVRITVTCVLTHERGHSERVSMWALPDDTGSKNRIQAIGSTVTYLQRYTLLAATGLAAAGTDDDGAVAGAARITAEQKEKIVALMKEVGADTERNTKVFLNYMRVGSLDEIPAARFDFALKALETKRGKNQ